VRVLTLGNLYPPQHLGGYELVWQAAVRALRRRGHVVRVLCTDTMLVPGAREQDEGVHRELRWYWRDYDWPRLRVRDRRAVERTDRAIVEGHVRDFAPDAVAFFAMGGLPMSLVTRNRLPAVGVVHDEWLSYGPREDQWHRLMRHRRLQADGRWLFVSEFIRQRALSSAWRLGDTAVAPSGIADAFLQPRPAPPWSWSLLYVGRADPRKGADVALAALEHLPPQATLTIAGPGEIGDAPRVRALGTVAQADLPYVYAAADAVLCPSRWEEPWGLAALEAMGLGRPVVATARGGSAEYLRDEVNALVVPPDDAQAVAAAVRRLAEDPGLRARLRDGGMATAREYTAERFHARVEDALADVVRARRPSASARFRRRRR
jgi:glycosyltransferase involved in cell wall biosynthesis